MATFSGVIKAALADVNTVKAAILKAIATVDTKVLPLAEAAQPIADAAANAVVPGASKFVDFGIALLEDVASALDAGGAAAEANLTNAGLDSSAIAAIKGLIPQLKTLKATTLGSTAPASA